MLADGTGTHQAPVPDAWWQGSGNRLLFVLRLAPPVRAALTDAIGAAGIPTALGTEAFPPQLWHQSVSDRYADRPGIRDRLLAAGAQVRAPGFMIELDQLRAAGNPRGSFNVEARQRGGCPELTTLVEQINAAAAAQGLPRGRGHSPHVTLSYSFGGQLSRTQPMVCVEWPVDAFELVVGGGRPYTYTTLGRWELEPPAPRASQPSLF